MTFDTSGQADSVADQGSDILVLGNNNSCDDGYINDDDDDDEVLITNVDKDQCLNSLVLCYLKLQANSCCQLRLLEIVLKNST